MDHIKAIGFDLFNTLITAEPQALDEAVNRLTHSLRQGGLALEHEAFIPAYRDAAMRFIKDTRLDGRETHNRFWISAALETLGYDVPPDDPSVARAVDAYFSVFLPHCHLIPGTSEMLGALKGQYRLGLLSNFTHAPAAMEIIEGMGLTPFFDVVLVSGEMGYRKPHPLVFRRLIDRLGVEKNEALFVGDDLEADITGARRAGLRPIWMTYARDKKMPLVPGITSEPAEEADSKVPRISHWKELTALLDAE